MKAGNSLPLPHTETFILAFKRLPVQSQNETAIIHPHTSGSLGLRFVFKIKLEYKHPAPDSQTFGLVDHLTPTVVD